MENEECVENKECGNAEYKKCKVCGKQGVWVMQSVWKIKSAEMRSMENAKCVENKEYGKCRVCGK